MGKSQRKTSQNFDKEEDTFLNINTLFYAIIKIRTNNVYVQNKWCKIRDTNQERNTANVRRQKPGVSSNIQMNVPYTQKKKLYLKEANKEILLYRT